MSEQEKDLTTESAVEMGGGLAPQPEDAGGTNGAGYADLPSEAAVSEEPVAEEPAAKELVFEDVGVQEGADTMTADQLLGSTDQPADNTETAEAELLAI